MHLVTASDLRQTSFPQPRHVVSGLLTEGLAILAGDPKIGKSWLALQISQAVSAGRPFLGLETDEGDALYLAYEDSPRRLQQRLERQGFDPVGNERLRFSFDAGDLSRVEETIRTWAAACEDPRLVIIDTFARADTPMVGRTNEYKHVTQLLGPIQRLALELQITILIVHHTNKDLPSSPNADPFRRIHGSQALFGTADMAMVLTRTRNGRDAVLHFTGRDSPDTDIDLAWHDDRCRWGRDQREPDRWPQETGKRRKVLRFLDEHGGSATLDEIRAAVDDGRITNATPNTLKKLVEDGLLEKPERGQYRLADPGGPSGSPVPAEADEVSEDGEDPSVAAADPSPADVPFDW